MKLYGINIKEYSFSEMYQKYADKLSSYRINKASRCRFEQDKALSFGAGVLLYRALAAYGIDEKECEYGILDRGRPYIANHTELDFNISHSGEIAVLAINQKEPEDVCGNCRDNQDFSVGVDIQRLTAYNDKIAKRLFRKEDYEMLADLQERDRNKADRCFTEIWTKRESVSKLFGSGILFSDELQKRVMDERYLEESGIFINTFDVCASSERYLCSLAGRTKQVLELDKIQFINI